MRIFALILVMAALACSQGSEKPAGPCQVKLTPEQLKTLNYGGYAPAPEYKVVKSGTGKAMLILGTGSTAGPSPLRKGDLLLAVDGCKIEDYLQTFLELSQRKDVIHRVKYLLYFPGDRARGIKRAEVIRNGRKIELKL